jgi:hypothetical protein
VPFLFCVSGGQMRAAVRQDAPAFWTERRSREARRVETAEGLFRVNLSGRASFTLPPGVREPTAGSCRKSNRSLRASRR